MSYQGTIMTNLTQDTYQFLRSGLDLADKIKEIKIILHIMNINEYKNNDDMKFYL